MFQMELFPEEYNLLKYKHNPVNQRRGKKLVVQTLMYSRATKLHIQVGQIFSL